MIVVPRATELEVQVLMASADPDDRGLQAWTDLSGVVINRVYGR
jgi:hypothetical protein